MIGSRSFVLQGIARAHPRARIGSTSRRSIRWCLDVIMYGRALDIMAYARDAASARQGRRGLGACLRLRVFSALCIVYPYEYENRYVHAVIFLSDSTHMPHDMYPDRPIAREPAGPVPQWPGARQEIPTYASWQQAASAPALCVGRAHVRVHGAPLFMRAGATRAKESPSRHSFEHLQ